MAVPSSSPRPASSRRTASIFQTSPFGAQTTLAYSENHTGIGGTLPVTDGRHAAAVAVLGNYMAEFRHRSRQPRRHARHGRVANGEPVSAVDHVR